MKQLTKLHSLGQVNRFPSTHWAHSCHTEAVGLPRGQAIHHTLGSRHQLVAQPPLAHGPLLHLHTVATETTASITHGSCPRQCHSVAAASHHFSILWGVREAWGKGTQSGGWLPVGTNSPSGSHWTLILVAGGVAVPEGSVLLYLVAQPISGSEGCCPGPMVAHLRVTWRLYVSRAHPVWRAPGGLCTSCLPRAGLRSALGVGGAEGEVEQNEGTLAL